MKALIFDIDRTLSNVDHRQHHVSDGKRCWDAFYGAMFDDPPVEDVCAFAELIATHHAVNNEELTLFICTGRPEEYRKVTEMWLREHVPCLSQMAEALLMRPYKDYRADTVIKKEMLDGIRGQGYYVMGAVDDRQSVVDMWRANDVTCFQVAPSDWDKGGVECEPGALMLMVGPSGAGKTTYIDSNAYPYDMVVSSDKLREQICGNFRDQSKNAQVFSALRAIVKARITNGLHVIVDSTNIRDRDRRQLRDLVPANCKIRYTVMNRSMDDKMRDAGWRSDVEIGGVPLILKHEQVFLSNLKNILAGDGDPRVKVIAHPPVK